MAHSWPLSDARVYQTLGGQTDTTAKDPRVIVAIRLTNNPLLSTLDPGQSLRDATIRFLDGGNGSEKIKIERLG